MEWLEEGRALRTWLFNQSHTSRRCRLVRAPVKPTQCWGSVMMLATSLCSLALLEQSSPDLCLLTCKNPHYQPFCRCHRSHLICSSSPRPHSQRLLIMQKNKASFLITSCSLRAAGADLKRRGLKLKRQIGSEGCLFNI